MAIYLNFCYLAPLFLPLYLSYIRVREGLTYSLKVTICTEEYK